MNTITKQSFNSGIVRVHRVFECGAGIGKGKKKLSRTEKLLLLYLSCRCPKETPDQTYVSIENIAFYTLMSPATISRGLSGLQKKGLITRSVRNNNPMSSRLTKLNWDRIDDFRAPYEGGPSAEGEDEPEEIEARKDILEMISQAFPGHPDLQTPESSPSLVQSVKDLMERFPVDLLSGLFYVICRDDSRTGSGIRARVSKCNNIGPYLKACVPDWVQTYQSQIDALWSEEGEESE